MRTRVLFAMASLVAVAGMIWGSVAPASACSCALPLTDEVAREVLEGSDLVVTAAVAEGEADRVVMTVERVYAGESGESVMVAQPEGFSGEYGDTGNLFGGEIGADCSYAISGGQGARYLLVLNESSGGIYEAQGCTSMALKLIETDDYFAESFAAIERVAGPGVLPQVAEEDSSGSSWVPVAGAVGVGAVLGLVGVGVFVWRRGRR